MGWERKLLIGVAVVGATAAVGIRAYKSWLLEQSAKRVIADYQHSSEELDEIDIRDSASKALAGEIGATLHRKRCRPEQRRRLAHAVAAVAYCQYGVRERTGANDAITRKFVRDLLEDSKDIRHSDRGRIIDAAVSLSYLPSASMEWIRTFESTAAYQQATYVPAGPRRF